jgi:hypothetical protein
MTALKLEWWAKVHDLTPAQVRLALNTMAVGQDAWPPGPRAFRKLALAEDDAQQRHDRPARAEAQKGGLEDRRRVFRLTFRDRVTQRRCGLGALPVFFRSEACPKLFGPGCARQRAGAFHLPDRNTVGQTRKFANVFNVGDGGGWTT